MVSGSAKHALSAALAVLRQGEHDAAAVRAASRATDDAEVAAMEESNTNAREQLLKAVQAARGEIASARARLRRSASKRKVEQLLGDNTVKDNQSAAEVVARDINESLRRSTGVVTQEVARSNAAGQVVAESGHTMRRTKDTHESYGRGLKDGASIMKELKRAERRANAVLAVSVAFFAIVVMYVLYRRAQRSVAAAVLIRPALRVASAPFVVAKKMVRIIGRRASARNTTTRTGKQRLQQMKVKEIRQPPPRSPPDEARKYTPPAQHNVCARKKAYL